MTSTTISTSTNRYKSSIMSPPTPAEAAAAARQFDIEAFTFLAVASCMTILRTYIRARAVAFKALQLDDYFVWLGTIFHGVETGMAWLVTHQVHGLANNGLTEAQRLSLSQTSPEYSLRVTGSKIQLGGWTAYSVLLWALKTSLLFLYARLTTGLGRGYQIRVRVGFAFIGASWLLLILTILFECHPFHKNWQINPDPGNVCQPAVSQLVIISSLVMNVATDLYLISIPLPMLWGSMLKPLKKIALMMIFSSGLFVIACAMIRSILMLTVCLLSSQILTIENPHADRFQPLSQDPVNGAQLAGSWSIRETFIAVVTTNLPVVTPFLTHIVAPYPCYFLSSMRSSKKSSSNQHNRDIRTWGQRSLSQDQRQRRGPPTANPITNLGCTESEERMIELQERNAASVGSKSQTVPGWRVPSNKTNANEIDVEIEVSVTEQARHDVEMGILRIQASARRPFCLRAGTRAR
ncbi:hypothetical protein N8I77_004764 [Diaporthe amygdali]|uniref:Rhodopsin domain-containing protein n=1 Tax=Phomopsis amygdali TaxID=1214568 RepID=A0AAD9W7C8_PHOAM|nr:hypothetical protein N8I77_004764 [Diaporthe amygdali]